MSIVVVIIVVLLLVISAAHGYLSQPTGYWGWALLLVVLLFLALLYVLGVLQ
jgi:hypothetical protein